MIPNMTLVPRLCISKCRLWMHFANMLRIPRVCLCTIMYNQETLLLLAILLGLFRLVAAGRLWLLNFCRVLDRDLVLGWLLLG